MQNKINFFYFIFLPFYFHNLSGYDAHLFFNELIKHYPDKEVTLLANTEEKYISFDFGCIRLLDSYRFMAFPLDYLANLLKQDQLKFVNKQNNVKQVLSLEIHLGPLPDYTITEKVYIHMNILKEMNLMI